MTRDLSTIALIGLILTGGASCTGDENTAAQAPLQATGPYVCGLVPKGVLAPLLGVESVQVSGEDPVNLAEGLTYCTFTVESESTSTPWFAQTWTTYAETGKDAEEEFEREEEWNPEARRLPAVSGLGRMRGAGSGLPRDYAVHALFRCGDVKRWIRIIVGETAEGRDPVADGTALMRMAQDRYAEVVGCEIKPLKSASPSPTGAG